MASLEDLQKEIEEIKNRNRRAEADKAWETSWARRFVILVLTYLVITIFFYFVRLSKPFINAIVPSLAFVISTLTLPVLKKWWVNKVNKN